MSYRRIWTKHFGKIPEGYEIHHKDGNRKNNSIENLMCVSPEEHLEIHKRQGDYYAAKMIADRIGEDIRNVMEMPEHRREEIRKRMTGDGNPMKRPEVKAKVAAALKGRKKCPKAEAKRLKSREGFKHTEETKKKMSKPKQKVTCPHCKLEGGISQMKRWHFNNCKVYGKKERSS